MSELYISRQTWSWCRFLSKAVRQKSCDIAVYKVLGIFGLDRKAKMTPLPIIYSSPHKAEYLLRDHDVDILVSEKRSAGVQAHQRGLHGGEGRGEKEHHN
jgi:hypothetical protein